jgi:hypothetical protein
MHKPITFSVVLGVALLGACLGVEAKPPSCVQPVGKWQNRQKSVLEIKTYDSATGAIWGEYTSHSGKSASSMPYPVVGWVNSTPAEPSAPGKSVNHAEVISFAVSWGKLGGLTAWTGTCGVNSQSSGLEQVSAVWHTTRPDTGFAWDHTLTGADRFDPIE